jgi:hypothetical protein
MPLVRMLHRPQADIRSGIPHLLPVEFLDRAQRCKILFDFATGQARTYTGFDAGFVSDGPRYCRAISTAKAAPVGERGNRDVADLS